MGQQHFKVAGSGVFTNTNFIGMCSLVSSAGYPCTVTLSGTVITLTNLTIGQKLDVAIFLQSASGTNAQITITQSVGLTTQAEFNVSSYEAVEGAATAASTERSCWTATSTTAALQYACASIGTGIIACDIFITTLPSNWS
jgi:hypothetical protein